MQKSCEKKLEIVLVLNKTSSHLNKIFFRSNKCFWAGILFTLQRNFNIFFKVMHTFRLSQKHLFSTRPNVTLKAKLLVFFSNFAHTYTILEIFVWTKSSYLFRLFAPCRKFSFKFNTVEYFKYPIFKTFLSQTPIILGQKPSFKSITGQKIIGALKQKSFGIQIFNLFDGVQFKWISTRWLKSLWHLQPHKKFQNWVRMGKVVGKIRVNWLSM